MRLREAGPSVRRDPWRAAAALRLLSGGLGGAGGSCCGFGASVARCVARLADPRRAAASRRQWLQRSVLPPGRRHPLSFRRSVPTPSPGPRAAAGPRLARCSRTRSRAASSPSSTASAASPCRSGTKRCAAGQGVGGADPTALAAAVGWCGDRASASRSVEWVQSAHRRVLKGKHVFAGARHCAALQTEGLSPGHPEQGQTGQARRVQASFVSSFLTD